MNKSKKERTLEAIEKMIEEHRKGVARYGVTKCKLCAVHLVKVELYSRPDCSGCPLARTTFDRKETVGCLLYGEHLNRRFDDEFSRLVISNIKSRMILKQKHIVPYLETLHEYLIHLSPKVFTKSYKYKRYPAVKNFRKMLIEGE